MKVFDQLARSRPPTDADPGTPNGPEQERSQAMRSGASSTGGGPADQGTGRIVDRAADGRTPSGTDPAKLSDAAVKAEAARRERAQFEETARQMREAVRADPQLAGLAMQLAIDVTPDGLRIQLLDADKQPMFPNGSSALSDRARALLAKVVPMLVRLPESISITGHTDASQFRGSERSNWDLSADRANATRRLLTDAGLPEARFRSVAGRADRDPLLPADASAAVNRRVAIIVHKQAGR